MRRTEINQMLVDALPKRDTSRRAVDHIAEAPAEIQRALQDFDLDGATLFEQAGAIIAAGWVNALSKNNRATVVIDLTKETAA
jgi:hypothetical protein